MDAVNEYRLRWPRVAFALVIVLVIAAIGLVIWNAELLPFAAMICVLAWFVFLAWPYPTLRLDPAGMLVRNPFSTRFVPYGVISEVSGGGRLQIELRGGAKVVATAISGNGVYLVNAMRKHEAHGQYVIPVRRVDDLRLDAGEDDTVATRVAQIIRRRMAQAPALDRRTEPPGRRVNWTTISISVCIAIAMIVVLVVT